MTAFTYDELDKLYSCVNSRLRLFEDVTKKEFINDLTLLKEFIVLKQLANKCLEAKIDLMKEPKNEQN